MTLVLVLRIVLISGKGAMRTVSIPISICLALLVTGSTSYAESAAPAQQKECFFRSQINGFNHAGKDQIYVHTGPREVYLFQTFPDCHDLDWSENIGIDQVGGGTICSGIDVTLIVPSPIGPRRCEVRMIRKLSEDEIKQRRGAR